VSVSKELILSLANAIFIQLSSYSEVIIIIKIFTHRALIIIGLGKRARAAIGTGKAWFFDRELRSTETKARQS